MTTVFQDFVDMAVEMIRDNGMFVTLRQPVQGNPIVSGQDWKPVNGTPTDTTNVKMIFFPEETINRYPEVRIPYDFIGEGFEYAIMANVSGVPVPNLESSIIRGTEHLRIKYVKPYSPDGTPIIYILGLKT